MSQQRVHASRLHQRPPESPARLHSQAARSSNIGAAVWMQVLRHALVLACCAYSSVQRLGCMLGFKGSREGPGPGQPHLQHKFVIRPLGGQQVNQVGQLQQHTEQEHATGSSSIQPLAGQTCQSRTQTRLERTSLVGSNTCKQSTQLCARQSKACKHCAPEGRAHQANPSKGRALIQNPSWPSPGRCLPAPCRPLASLPAPPAAPQPPAAHRPPTHLQEPAAGRAAAQQRGRDRLSVDDYAPMHHAVQAQAYHTA